MCIRKNYGNPFIEVGIFGVKEVDFYYHGCWSVPIVLLIYSNKHTDRVPFTDNNGKPRTGLSV